jgi:hypothetical protein
MSKRLGYEGYIFVTNSNGESGRVSIDSLSRDEVNRYAELIKMEEAGINTEGQVTRLPREEADKLMQLPPIMGNAPLKPLHGTQEGKLEDIRKMSTEEIIESLKPKPGNAESLKVRPDGTILNGHHRIRVLQERGVDPSNLPREIIPKEPIGPNP